MSDFRIKVEFKPQDCWIGVFWRRKLWMLDKDNSITLLRTTPPSPLVPHYDVWICLLPCLPIHLSWNNRGKVVGG